MVDILQGGGDPARAQRAAQTVAEKSFGATVTGDTVVLPGVMRRKKQIIPALKVS